MNNKFALSSYKRYNADPVESVLNSASSLPIFSVLEYSSGQDMETLSLPTTGDYTTDSSQPKYNVSWNLLEETMLWLQNIQEQEVVELQMTHHKINNTNNGKWTKTYYFSCSRNGTGGEKPYDKLHPEWGRKVPMKQTGCMCFLIVKLYPGTSCVLGKYTSNHNHLIGGVNAWFMCLSDVTKDQILEMLHMGISHDKIVSHNLYTPQ